MKSLKYAEPAVLLPIEPFLCHVISAFGFIIAQLTGGNVLLVNSSVTDPGNANTWLTLYGFAKASLVGSSSVTLLGNVVYTLIEWLPTAPKLAVANGTVAV